ncbi:MAG: hypothetical protein KDD12_16225 [Lewinella sp.]|nr:hypothetical protein [Lewinella sp.]
MKNRFFSGAFLVALCLPFLGTAQPPAPKDTIPKPEVSVTKHSITIDGKAVNYTTTAGTLLLRNEQDEPIALYGFTAYTKDGVNDKSARPVMFAYNGGPGSSSIWLHMGALGPKRTVVNDPGLTPASPYKLADNKYSVLDIADLVMIDPVGTGLSRPVGKATGKDFWGVDQDIRTVSQFIKQYVTENDRWNSPKYLLGESYGTMRNAGVVDYLQENIGMAMNGVIMVSAVFDLRTITFAPGDDIPYIIYLPSYAASAWYHDKLPNKPANLEAFVEEVRVFANGDYAAALMKGDRLSDQEREKILGKLVAYTGLSKNYIERADLRVGPGEFEQELLRDDHNTMGRLDSRFKGINQDLLSQNADYDPQSSSISPAYTATFMNYFYNELKVNKKNSYHISAYGTGGFRWDWMRGPGGFGVPGANTATDMADALSKNPNLKIVIFNGYYDLATPFNGVEYTIDHLGLEKNIKSNIIMKYYEAGHMMYTHEPSLAKFKQDIVEFFRMTGN